MLFLLLITSYKEEMKNWKKSLFKMMGKMSMFVAVYTVALGYPHCLIILHQPQVPEKLKKMREG